MNKLYLGWGGTEVKTLQFLLPADIHQVQGFFSGPGLSYI